MQVLEKGNPFPICVCCESESARSVQLGGKAAPTHCALLYLHASASLAPFLPSAPSHPTHPSHFRQSPPLIFTYIAKMVKATVIGAAGGIGQPLSLLLKQSSLVTDLALYDV